jgi:hypothetical protein
MYATICSQTSNIAQKFGISVRNAWAYFFWELFYFS